MHELVSSRRKRSFRCGPPLPFSDASPYHTELRHVAAAASQNRTTRLVTGLPLALTSAISVTAEKYCSQPPHGSLVAKLADLLITRAFALAMCSLRPTGSSVISQS